jgi:hypothetical protein
MAPGTLFAKVSQAEMGCPGRGPAGYNSSTLPISGDLQFFF